MVQFFPAYDQILIIRVERMKHNSVAALDVFFQGTVAIAYEYAKDAFPADTSFFSRNVTPEFTTACRFITSR